MSRLAKNNPALAFSLIACEDDNGTGAGAGDRKSNLVAAKWKLAAALVSPPVDYGEGNMISDLYPMMERIKDDVTTFKADGT